MITTNDKIISEFMKRINLDGRILGYSENNFQLFEIERCKKHNRIILRMEFLEISIHNNGNEKNNYGFRFPPFLKINVHKEFIFSMQSVSLKRRSLCLALDTDYEILNKLLKN